MYPAIVLVKYSQSINMRRGLRPRFNITGHGIWIKLSLPFMRWQSIALLPYLPFPTITLTSSTRYRGALLQHPVKVKIICDWCFYEKGFRTWLPVFFLTLVQHQTSGTVAEGRGTYRPRGSIGINTPPRMPHPKTLKGQIALLMCANACDKHKALGMSVTLIHSRPLWCFAHVSIATNHARRLRLEKLL